MELVKAVAISSGLVMQLLYRIGHQSGLTKRTFVLLASSFSVHYCKETVIDQQLGKLDAIVHLFPKFVRNYMLCCLCNQLFTARWSTPKVSTITSCVPSPRLCSSSRNKSNSTNASLLTIQSKIWILLGQSAECQWDTITNRDFGVANCTVG